MSVVIGIDPGLGGAIGVLSPNGIWVHDCPTVSTGGKLRYNPAAMAMLLQSYQRLYTRLLVGLEKVHSMPGQGVTSSFGFGEGYGIWQGILASQCIPHQLITPQSWKRSMMAGQSKDQDASRLVALRLFPEVGDRLQLKKDHGRADALLIAEHLRRQTLADGYSPHGKRPNQRIHASDLI